MSSRKNRPRGTSHERCHAGLDLTSEDEIGGTATPYFPWTVPVGHRGDDLRFSGMGWLMVSLALAQATRTAGCVSRTASHLFADLVVDEVRAVGYFGRDERVLRAHRLVMQVALLPLSKSPCRRPSPRVHCGTVQCPRAAPPPFPGCQAVVVCLSIDLVTGLSPRWDGKRFETIGESLLLLLLLQPSSSSLPPRHGWEDGMDMVAHTKSVFALCLREGGMAAYDGRCWWW